MIIETGTGIRNANSYLPSTYIDAYLSARGRSSENAWEDLTQGKKDEAAIAASQYADLRWGSQFSGYPASSISGYPATASISFSANPVNNSVLVLADTTYKFVSTLSSVRNEILIGATADVTAANLAAAINGANGAGTIYSSETPQSRHGSATVNAALVTVTLATNGASGNLTALTTTSVAIALTAFSGGLDEGQSLCFPRLDCYDAQGRIIVGIPDILKQAISEYAVRAAAESLLQDPEYDDRGGSVQHKIELVGPIKEETKYDPGTAGSIQFRSYPVPDNLMRQLLRSNRKEVIRG